jgi:hypothetical protein
MRPSEPGALCMEDVELIVSLQTNATGTWSFGDLRVYDRDTADPVRRALEGLKSSTVHQTFWVYNDFKGCLRF